MIIYKVNDDDDDDNMVVVVVLVAAAVIIVITEYLPHPSFRSSADFQVSMIQHIVSGTEITASCVYIAYFCTHLLRLLSSLHKITPKKQITQQEQV
jgi:hypothetical protein